MINYQFIDVNIKKNKIKYSMKKLLDKIIFSEGCTIKKVLDSFGKNQHLTNNRGFAIIINSKKKCVGTLSDGDVRRYLLKGGSINNHARLAMNRSFKYINEGDSRNIIIRKFESLFQEQKGVYVLPILNKNNLIKSIINYEELKKFKEIRKEIYVQIPCRISFSGGGLDFSDNINFNSNYVLCSAINKYVKIICRPREDGKIKIINDINNEITIVNDLKDLNSRKDFISKILCFANPSIGFDIEIYADVQFGTGLGTSSATVIAILAAMNKLHNKRRELYSLVEDAYQIERIELNNYGGWQDYYSTAFGGINWIEMNSRDILVNPLKISDDISRELQNNLILVNLGKRILNKKNNINKNIFYKKKNSILMKSISYKLKESLLKGRLENFAILMNDAWTLKKKINKKSNINKINKLYDNLKDKGVIGGKLLGAGGSGYMLLYAPIQKRRNVENLLNKKKLKYENLFFTTSGLKVWETSQI
jgi:D-glycero-alpha-D-manno-heptose-7-phosphate kinase